MRAMLVGPPKAGSTAACSLSPLSLPPELTCDKGKPAERRGRKAVRLKSSKAGEFHRPHWWGLPKRPSPRTRAVFWFRKRDFGHENNFPRDLEFSSLIVKQLT